MFGALNHFYSAPAKFFIDDNGRPNRINWYPAADGALIYEDWHTFAPRIDNLDDDATHLYEFTAKRTRARQYPRAFDLAHRPPGAHVDGDRDDFLGLSSKNKYAVGGHSPVDPCRVRHIRAGIFLGGEMPREKQPGYFLPAGVLIGAALVAPTAPTLRAGIFLGAVANPPPPPFRAGVFLGAIQFDPSISEGIPCEGCLPALVSAEIPVHLEFEGIPGLTSLDLVLGGMSGVDGIENFCVWTADTVIDGHAFHLEMRTRDTGYTLPMWRLFWNYLDYVHDGPYFGSNTPEDSFKVCSPFSFFGVGLWEGNTTSGSFGFSMPGEVALLEAGVLVGGVLIDPPPPVSQLDAGILLGATLIADTSELVAGILLGASLVEGAGTLEAGVLLGASIHGDTPPLEAGVLLGATLIEDVPPLRAGVLIGATLIEDTAPLEAGLLLGATLIEQTETLSAGVLLGATLT